MDSKVKLSVCSLNGLKTLKRFIQCHGNCSVRWLLRLKWKQGVIDTAETMRGECSISTSKLALSMISFFTSWGGSAWLFTGEILQ